MSVKISQMPSAPTVNGSDLIPIVQAGLNKTTTPAGILSSLLFQRAAVGAQVIAINTYFLTAPFVALTEFITNGADYQSAFQNAITYCGLTGVGLYVPPGNYPTSPITVTAALTMLGAGDGVTFINAITTTQDVFQVTTDAPLIWRDLAVTGKSNATAGALLRLSGNASQNLYSTFFNVRFQNGWDQFVTIKAAAWSCINCKFFSPQDAGMTVENDFNVDGGDMGVFDCKFIGGGVGTAVTQFSAGGMRFHGNKVINWANGYIVSLQVGVHTGDLFINGCSFEANSGTAIGISKGSGTVFSAIHINDNEISVCNVGISVSPDTGPWSAVLTINDNDIEFGDPLIPGTPGVGISLGGITQVNIHDNKILTHTATGTGIALGVTAVSVVLIHDNIFNAMTNPITGVVAGKGYIIHDNSGYNPVGVFALAPGASPWTFTNGPTDSDLSLASTVGITNITVGGLSILAGSTAANVAYPVHVGPNEAIVITYGGVLTGRQMIH